MLRLRQQYSLLWIKESNNLVLEDTKGFILQHAGSKQHCNDLFYGLKQINIEQVKKQTLFRFHFQSNSEMAILGGLLWCNCYWMRAATTKRWSQHPCQEDADLHVCFPWLRKYFYGVSHSGGRALNFHPFQHKPALQMAMRRNESGPHQP